MYLLTICQQCIAPQESKIIHGLHGHFRAKFCNDDNPSLHDLGQLIYFFDWMQLIYIVAYYFIVDELTCIAENSLEKNLPLDALNQQLTRLRCIHHGDHVYHPKFHISFSHFLIWMPYGDDVPFILYGMVWVGMVHDFGGRVLGGSIVFLPLKGNHVLAQDQHALYTYHEWRGGQHGIGPLSYHVHLFIPPTF